MDVQIARKNVLEPWQQQACEQVAAFRKRTGLSLGEFAHLVGADKRSIWRWERKEFCPTTEHLKRLKAVQDLWANLNTRDRVLPISFDDTRPPRSKRIQGDDLRKMAPRLLSRLIRDVCGGRIQIPSEEIKGFVPQVQAKLDLESGALIAWVARGRKKVEGVPCR